MSEAFKCDFCGDEEISRLKIYKSGPIFIDIQTEVLVVNDWAACNICADLIDSYRDIELLNRAVKAHGPFKKIQDRITCEQVLYMTYSQFFQYQRIYNVPNRNDLSSNTDSAH